MNPKSVLTISLDPDIDYLGSKASHELIERSIVDEVLNGYKLRVVKPNFSFFGRKKLALAKNSGPKEIEKERRIPKIRQWSKPKNLRSRSPCVCKYSNRRTKKSKNVNCPMRIAELAVPTKRYCLETWKNNYNTLPIFMVERLKQQVLDLKPVIQVADAMNYFRNHRINVRKRNIRNCKRICKQRENQVTACEMQIKRFCALFSLGMARKLSRRVNITLSPELERLSRIISYDLYLINKKKNLNVTYKRILNEMSAKIAVWIDGILDDLPYKLMEDDLRDLEEKEGPVLDILDDLIDDVMGIFQSAYTSPYSSSEPPASVCSSTSLKSTQQEEPISIEDDIKNELENIVSFIENQITVKENFENLIPDSYNENIENEERASVSENDDETNELSPNEAEDMSKENNALDENNELLTQNENASENMSKANTDVDDNNELLPENENFMDLPFKGEETDESPNQINDSIAENVSKENNVLEVNSEDSDENRKVQFFVDMGVGTDIGGLTKEPEEEASENTPVEPLLHLNISHDHLLNIVLAPPNDHLLSDADEIWPPSVSRIKPSQSLHRSISSLEKIIECNEKVVSNYASILLDIPERKTDEKDEMKAMDNQNETDIKLNERELFVFSDEIDGKVDIIDKHEEVIDKTNIRNDEQGENYVLDIKVTHTVLPAVQMSVIANIKANVKQYYEKTIIEDKPHKRKFDYRVHLKTAPSWVTRSIAEDAIGKILDAKYENEIRQWSKKLERIYSYLEIWNVWLQNTCKNVIYLKSRTDYNKLFRPCTIKKDLKDWAKLGRDFERDRILWAKNNRMKKHLKYYRHLYGRHIMNVTARHKSTCNCKTIKTKHG